MKNTSISLHFDNYLDLYVQAMELIDKETLEKVKSELKKAFSEERFIYFCGNGGSAEISNHMKCDFLKGIRKNTDIETKILSLSADIGLITAIANDISYEDIFSYQIEALASRGDILVTVSSSGDSENILRAIKSARRIGLKTVSLTGFNGGRSSKEADLNLHINSKNYGVVEDAHQSILHILAQSLRMDGLQDTENTIL